MGKESAAMIRVGVGGWVYPEWRGGVFYPKGLRQADELAFASARFTATEINATFYRTQTPETFAAWAAGSAEGFVFAVKGPNAVTVRRELAGTGPQLERFFASGLERLGDKLGPINWQLAGTKKFDREDLAGFLKVLPRTLQGRPLRHALEARHESFADPAAAALLKDENVALVLADAEDYANFDADTADFRYARLQRMSEDVPTGYDDGALDGFAEQAKDWAAKGDAYIFMINGAKIRAPAAAQALQQRFV